MASLHRNLNLETAVIEARAAYETGHPESLKYFQAAQSVMPGGNTRSVLHYGPFPFTVVKGEGARIWDADGNDYGDFLGEYTAGLYGHNNPIIEAAVAKALKNGVVLGGPNIVEAKLARLICERFHAVERLRFTNSGTESNILAISAARAFTGRSDIIVVDRAYHGGVLTFEGKSPLNVPFPIHKITFNQPDDARDTIRRLGDRLAAVLVEPMIGAGGGIPGDAEFHKALRDTSQEVGALLIFDEVMTSRHTAGGMQGYYQITPDLVSFGKYLGGGLTFGAFGGRADIIDRFDPTKPNAWGHAGTFNNNILTMSAGYAGLSEVYTPDVADGLFETGNAFRAAMQADLAKIDVPMQITGLGSMMVFHFADAPPTAPMDPGASPKELYELLHLDMIERGHFYARRGMINLSIATTQAEMDAFRAAFIDVIEARAPLIREAIG